MDLGRLIVGYKRHTIVGDIEKSKALLETLLADAPRLAPINIIEYADDLSVSGYGTRISYLDSDRETIRHPPSTTIVLMAEYDESCPIVADFLGRCADALLEVTEDNQLKLVDAEPDFFSKSLTK